MSIISTQSAAKKWVEEKSPLFDCVRGGYVRARLGQHEFMSKFEGIRHSPLTSLKNRPDRRTSPDGLLYSPQCFTVEFSDGRIVLMCEDANIYMITDGLVIEYGFEEAPLIIKKETSI